MKILAIRGANLASLAGEFEINLDQPPLADAGLFAITGPTGAGKSTLLDALCLALYDRVPRLAGVAGVEVGQAQETKKLRSDDCRTVLRRGAVEGFAEVDFRGIDGGCYRARWSVRRARRKPDGAPQAQELTLIDLAGNQSLGHKKTEVLEATAKRLGLTFDQFRRSVLLAQGDFAAFLKASSKDNSELLERITGTGIYSRLSKAAHERNRQAAAAVADVERQLEQLKPLSAAEREDLERQHAARQDALNRADQSRQAAQLAIDWHRRLATLQAEEQMAAQDLEDAARHWQAAGPRRLRLETVRRVQPLRGAVETVERLRGQAAEAQTALQEAMTAKAAATAEAGQRQAAWESARNALRSAEQILAESRPLLHQARELDTRIAQG
ncbi:MAG: AAA family ATPase, partial [Pseudomonadota bacterium]|nr:AAA family ATPase [Pseudomonadota bacterium]